MKKIIALIILGAVMISTTVWLANYLSTGTIIITAGKDDTVTLEKTSAGKPFTQIATGSLSATVEHGQYTATIQNGSKTTIQVIDFGSGHKTFRYDISSTELLGVEPVTYESAQDLAVTPNRLTYLDNASHTLHQIDAGNDPRQINTQQFRKVSWADSTFGVGQDSDGILYVITGNSINPLDVPFSYDGGAVNFDVSPHRRVYISHGADVYSGRRTKNFKKIYTASSSKPTLAAGTNIVAVADNKYGGSATDISKPLLATIDTSGSETRKNIEAEMMAWSPDGQHLATVNQSNPAIYNADLHQVATFPTSSVVGQFAWLNNTSLFYSSNYEVWTYDVATQIIQLSANVVTSDSVTGMYPNSDNSYMYITTFDPVSLNPAIRRIGLKDQRVPNNINKLRGVLPEGGTGYFMNLVNFSSPPAVLVQPYSYAQPGNYVQRARTQLQREGVNTNQLNFRLGRTIIGD